MTVLFDIASALLTISIILTKIQIVFVNAVK